MPNDIARFKDFAPRLKAYRGDAAVPWPAKSNPSVSELLSRNGALARQNRRLSVALARLTEHATTMLSRLTPRQREVMAMVLEGHPSKNIAVDLNISQRTVENHRAAIMRRTGASSLPELVRLSLGVS